MPPKKLILSINAGSSSLKLSLYSAVQRDPQPKLVLTSSVSGLTSPPAVFSYVHASNPLPPTTVKSKQLSEVSSQDDAFKYFLEYLFNDTEVTEIEGGGDIAFACHRVVHGGDYEQPVLICGDTLPYLEEFTGLAPLSVFPRTFLASVELSAK
jgi:acetate kinase